MPESPKTRKTAHITYKDYKKRVGRRNNQSMIIFVSAFFMMLLIFLGIAKQISPDVDVSIGENEMTREEMVKSSVDDRLKLIHMEDNAYDSTTNDETFSPELEEKVKLPSNANKKDEESEVADEWLDLSSANKKKEATKVEKKIDSATQSTLDETMKHHQEIIKNLNNMQQSHPLPMNNAQNSMPNSAQIRVQQPAQSQVQKAPTSAPTPQKTISAKVVVGNYATMEQAQVAKGIISEAGLNIDPFVRKIGGTYTIQTGSFTSKEKAQAAANDLLRNNFPARVIEE